MGCGRRSLQRPSSVGDISSSYATSHVDGFHNASDERAGNSPPFNCSTPDVLILMVTTDPSKQLEIEARRAGIKGLCPKNEIQCLLKAVEVVLGGGTYFSEDAAA
jgi:hypothetical protein